MVEPFEFRIYFNLSVRVSLDIHNARNIFSNFVHLTSKLDSNYMKIKII